MHNQIAIDVIEQPAMIIDLASPAICAANAPARALWGLGAGDAIPLPLDPDMPALTELRRAADAAGDDAAPVDATNRQTMAPAVFWTAAGAQRLNCRIEARPAPDAALIIFETVKPPPAETQARPPGELAETAEPATPRSPTFDAMAHELRTPIGAIIALAEMIETEQFGPVGDPRYLDYARDIKEGARLSLRIVANALAREPQDRSNGLLGSFAELNVEELIDKSLSMVQHPAREANVHLVSDLPDSLPNLIADAAGLTQILLNLFGNAVKFTPENGTITVSARLTDDGGLAISVRDTGVGMTGIEASVLIDADRCRDRQAGTASGSTQRGIGFSLVRRLADAMSADLAVSSTRSVGTCVTLTFPPATVIPVPHGEEKR